MRIVICFFVFTIVFSGGIKAQVSYVLQNYNLYYTDEFTPRLTISTKSVMSEYFNLTSYFYANKKWGQGLVGFDFKPAKWLTLGAKAGLLTSTGNSFRFSVAAGLRFGLFAARAKLEYGGDKDRHNLVIDHGINKGKIRIGLHGLKYINIYATGIRIQAKLGKWPANVWVSNLWDVTYDNYACLFGVYFIFNENTFKHNKDNVYPLK